MLPPLCAAAALPPQLTRRSLPQVWQITAGYGNTEAVPAPPLIATAGFKERRRTTAKRNVAWEWKPFTSSARTDGLPLWHWVKVRAARPFHGAARR